MHRLLQPVDGAVVVPVRVGSGHRRGPSPADVRSKRWRRTSRGYYVPAETPRTPEQRVLEAAMVLTESTGVTGWAALRWMGAPWFDGTSHGGRIELPVDLVSACREMRHQAGFRVSQERLNPAELLEHRAVRLTNAVRSTCFLMRYAASLTAAVVAADMAAYSDLVSVRELEDYVVAHPGWTGVPRARQALPLVSENSWSPMETVVRMVWTRDAGLPALLVNRPVFDAAGHHVATPDLLEPETGLAIEYDGAVHLAGLQRHRDLHREQAMRDVGLDYLTVLQQDAADRYRLAEGLVRAHRRAAGTRRTQSWTITPPAWWRSLDTVEERRARRALAISA